MLSDMARRHFSLSEAEHPLTPAIFFVFFTFLAILPLLWAHDSKALRYVGNRQFFSWSAVSESSFRDTSSARFS
jgi:hypothetical protein